LLDLCAATATAKRISGCKNYHPTLFDGVPLSFEAGRAGLLEGCLLLLDRFLLLLCCLLGGSHILPAALAAPGHCTGSSSCLGIVGNNLAYDCATCSPFYTCPRLASSCCCRWLGRFY